MSIERGSNYYDEIYSKSEEYKKKYSSSVYYSLWKEVIKLIPPQVVINEIGCGTGQFADFLNGSGYIGGCGFDFSEVAITQAKKLNLQRFKFFVEDCTKVSFTGDFFVCLETFEHTKDFKIIENIGLGKEIVFTVPDFNDPSHVRYFHSINEVVDRYKNVIKFSHVQKFDRWFICKGVTI